MSYRYKTYSFAYRKDDIEDYLRNKGYSVETINKVIDLLPSLKDKKKSIFKGRQDYNPDSPPSVIFSRKFAWKNDEELIDIELSLLQAVEKWEELKKGEGSSCVEGFWVSNNAGAWEFERLLQGGKKYIVEHVFYSLMKERLGDLVLK